MSKSDGLRAFRKPAAAANDAGLPAPEGKAARAVQAGILFGIGAYGLWGLLPLYFVALEPAGAVEIVANRVLWSLLFCVLLVTAMRNWPALLATVRSRKAMGALSVAAALIAGNWLLYTVAVTTGRAVEASLGYFINPLVSVLLGVLVLKERLRPLQWAAIVVSTVAVLVLAFGYGSVPWLALGVAGSFGLYGLVKNRVGSAVDATSSLTVETAVLTPLAAAVMLWLGATGGATLTTEGPGHFWLMAAGGLITALPLLFFGAAARRLPLSTIGLLQYLAPTLQFILALTVLGEQMVLERWIGFGLVWLALVILTTDMLVSVRRSARLRKRTVQ